MGVGFTKAGVAASAASAVAKVKLVAMARKPASNSTLGPTSCKPSVDGSGKPLLRKPFKMSFSSGKKVWKRDCGKMGRHGSYAWASVNGGKARATHTWMGAKLMVPTCEPVRVRSSSSSVMLSTNTGFVAAGFT